MQLTSEEEQLIVHTLRSKTFSFPLFWYIFQRATSLIPTCPLFESCSVYVCNTVQLSNTPLNLPALLQFVAMPEMSSSAHYVPHQLKQKAIKVHAGYCWFNVDGYVHICIQPRWCG